ncbi:hypothetical protein AB0F46_18700 [Streptomyces sp. NPDC026665]|uniref:hypothetical protein n=1 Tax=Streptomyces sp. NPDC026665 TaxID=3154798 RepID=UPI0033E162C5
MTRQAESVEGRYHLTLALKGKASMHGWWSSEATARGQFPGWIGTWGVPGARITLVDEQTGSVLTHWPEES